MDLTEAESGLLFSSVSKESAWSAGELSSIPGSGRSSGEGNGSPLQYTCLENPMDRRTWRASVHGVTRIGHELTTKPPPTTEAEDIRKSCQEYTELYKKDLDDPDKYNGVITHLQPDIQECKVKQALGSITMNKASGDDGTPIELVQVLKDDAIQVLYSMCQEIWKTHQWPQ